MRVSTWSLAFLLCVSTLASADLKIKTRTTVMGHSTESTVYIKGSRERTEMSFGGRRSCQYHPVRSETHGHCDGGSLHRDVDWRRELLSRHVGHASHGQERRYGRRRADAGRQGRRCNYFSHGHGYGRTSGRCSATRHGISEVP